MRALPIHAEAEALANSYAPREFGGALFAVRSIAKQLWGRNVFVKLTGSYLQGTAVPSSDLDVCIEFCVNESNKFAKQTDQELLTSMWSFVKSNSATCAGMTTTPALDELNSTIETRSPTQLVLLKLLYEPLDIVVDVALAKENTGFTDLHIGTLVESRPSVHTAVRLLRMWALRRSVVGGSDGYPNPISWTLLFLVLLQSHNILPVLTAESSQPARAAAPVVTPPAPELLQLLFSYIASTAGEQVTLVRFKGGEVERKNRQELAKHPVAQYMMASNRPLIVDDPSKENHNLAAACKKPQWADIVAEAQRASALLKQGFCGKSDALAELLESRDKQVFPSAQHERPGKKKARNDLKATVAPSAARTRRGGKMLCLKSYTAGMRVIVRGTEDKVLNGKTATVVRQAKGAKGVETNTLVELDSPPDTTALLNAHNLMLLPDSEDDDGSGTSSKSAR